MTHREALERVAQAEAAWMNANLASLKGEPGGATREATAWSAKKAAWAEADKTWYEENPR